MPVAEGGAERELVFLYSYGMGGWGDLLKGLHTCWCWAKASGRTLRISFERHVFGLVFPQYRPAVGVQRYCVLIDKVGSVKTEDVLAWKEQSIGVCCNWFSPASVEGVATADILSFYDAVYTELFPLLEEAERIEGAYKVFHCRMGDKYLAEATACKSDNRLGSMTDLVAKLDRYMGMRKGDRTLVCSDSASMIRSLLQRIPNSVCVCKEPYHIAYMNRDAEGSLEGMIDYVRRIREMIAEHRAMSRAELVYMASYSGFPITAAMIGNVSLLLAGEEYHDEYVDFIRRLRSV